MMDIFMENMIRSHQQDLWKVISQAFEKHFGFPISQIPPQTIEQRHYEGSPIVEYWFNDERFLEYNKNTQFDIKQGKDSYQVTATNYYKEV